MTQVKTGKIQVSVSPRFSHFCFRAALRGRALPVDRLLPLACADGKRHSVAGLMIGGGGVNGENSVLLGNGRGHGARGAGAQDA